MQVFRPKAKDGAIPEEISPIKHQNATKKMCYSYQQTQDFLTILIDILIVIEIFVLPVFYIVERSVKEVKSWSVPTPEKVNSPTDQPIQKAKVSAKEVEKIKPEIEEITLSIEESNSLAKQKMKSKIETPTPKTRKTRAKKSKLETVQA